MVRICFVVFVGEFEPSAAVGFRSRVCSGKDLFGSI